MLVDLPESIALVTVTRLPIFRGIHYLQYYYYPSDNDCEPRLLAGIEDILL